MAAQVQWVKVGTDVIVGGTAGAVDQLIQNVDQKREVERAEKLPILSQYGTYLNYGVPILAILATTFGFLKGDWATRAVTAGSVLAGRKVTYQVTKKSPSTWTGWTRERQLEASQKTAEATRLKEVARQRALAQGARAQVGGDVSRIGIPIIANETVLV